MIDYPATLIDGSGRLWEWSPTWNGYRAPEMLTHGYDEIARRWGIQAEPPAAVSVLGRVVTSEEGAEGDLLMIRTGDEWLTYRMRAGEIAALREHFRNEARDPERVREARAHVTEAVERFVAAEVVLANGMSAAWNHRAKREHSRALGDLNAALNALERAL